ncbi:restriction endonuclease subunit S [Clostridium saccharobutylicum]|uniref:Restriction modification system domain-containing protein n=1 Tax=Clostridium saccharobutylicum DSM 13864 TaxID=1345695 RepID=U5MLL3_CLOSA|nr:restriction endonuclease subunit S [Clostridium saccharobutylicum]AGX41475.1 restriction modification system domain-containing protein [Clostridium saccharobutylicum DSM 13864]AQR88755.1 EcoKI restriction-modification system protein HsdS [Clostridium saccharobutylicum]AQR98653.1 EcoKI restriction-modification system protein HsdS [Clostridium saccharobutylicum]AQS12643.1 EcoKI restriction-modification system protein HsdS [Clostridium saccharobutylicum]MBA8896811.1 type I restriction enzyme S
MKNIELPKDWKMDTLDNATSIIRNGANIKQGEDGGYPITRIETISNSFIDINKFGYAGIEELGKYKDYLLQQGDILMSHINSEKHLGKVAIYENCNIEIIHGMNLLCIRFNNEIILSKYAYYFLNTKRFKIQLPRITKKSVNQASFSINDLKNLKIIIPPLEIQKKIINVLEKSEKALEKRMESIKLLDELVKSRFIEMFGDPIRNPMNLLKAELGKVGEWKTGGTPSRSNNEYYNGNIPWLSSGELNNMYCFKSVEMITELAIKESSAKIIEKGSLLLGMYDTAALKSTINMIECSCNQAIAYSKLDEKLVNTIYVYYCIQIGKDFYKSQQRGVRQKNLNLSMIKGLEILMPDLKRQNQFADFINQVDKLKFEMQKSLEEMENNFNSLMQRAFKGELFN